MWLFKNGVNRNIDVKPNDFTTSVWNKDGWLPSNFGNFDPKTQNIISTSILPDRVEFSFGPKVVPNQEIITKLVVAVQAHLDNTARQRNYDGILSACTYATSSNLKFQAEGQACVLWRDAVWAKCYEVLTACQNSLRSIPTSEQLISELPIFTWPVT